MPIRRRRVQKSLNKNLQKAMRRQAQDDQAKTAVRLGSRYSTVSHLDIQMEFVSPEGHILSSENRIFTPSDILDFSAPCQGRCGNGRMDLEGKMDEIITARQSYCETKGVCRELVYAGTNDVCGFELRCKIKVGYLEVAPQTTVKV